MSNIITVTDIQWDTTTDEDPSASVTHKLPTSFQLELDQDDFINDDAISDMIADMLSDETGWCVSGFNYTIG